MCLKISRVERTFAYNWAGDQIVSPLVTAARLVPGSKRTSLDMGMSASSWPKHSAEVRHFFLRNIVDSRPVQERERFFVGRKGTFDWRMRCVIEAFGSFRHRPAKGRGREAWLLPAETLANGGGDCEDLAFLLVALLGEAGISQSCLRLAFGHLVETRPDGGQRRFAHAWVMYQLEGGAWMILDPMERVDQRLRAKSAVKPAAPVASATYEYQPVFVFNRDHLWRVHGPKGEKPSCNLDTYLGRRKFWKHYDPAFAMGVHNDIFDNQMKELSCFERFAVKTASLALDANVLSYDPRDHCDFAYIETTSAGSSGTGSSADQGATAISGVTLATDLLGASFVLSSQGTGTGSETGTVQDVIFEPRIGKLQYLVVSFGSTDTWIPVPIGALGWDSTNNQLALMVDASMLQSAPAFSGGQMPDTSMQGWDEQFSTYWSGGGTGSGSGSGTDTATATATP